MIQIREIGPRSELARALIQELDRYLMSLYPPESNHLDPIDELEKPHVHFLGAFEGEKLLGCGAVKLMKEGYGEIKRIWVVPDTRGRGVATALLRRLEAILLEAGTPVARLETGVLQTEAIGLFRKCGYVTTGPFGGYKADPLSVFMEKRLGPGS